MSAALACGPEAITYMHPCICFPNHVRNCMAVLVHHANMHFEAKDWISSDGIRMIDETASVTWIKIGVRALAGLDGYILFLFYLFITFVPAVTASLHPNPQTMLKISM